MDPQWFGRHLAYTMSKYSMSLIVLGLADELKADGIAVNALWPKTVIATAAVQNMPGGDELMKSSRIPQIMGDAAYTIINQPSKACTGNFFIDEDVLREKGMTDFDKYAVDSSRELLPDFFL